MSLRPRAADRTPIPPLADDAAYARLAAQLSALRRGFEERKDKLEVYAIQGELARGSSSERGERKQRLRDREAQLRAKRPAPKTSLAPADGLHPIVALGLKLAAGEALPPPPDRSGHIATLRAETAQIDDAMRLVHIQLDEVRAERSREVAEQLLPQQREILRSKRDAALALAAAVQAERELTAALLHAGYEMQPGVLRSPPLDPAARLGTQAEFDSAVSTYVRALETIGVI